MDFQGAQQLHQAGRFNEAEAAYKGLLAASPANPALLQRLSQLYLQTRRPDLAVEALQRIIAIEPSLLAWRDQLADLLGRMGRLQDAADVYSDFVTSQPPNANAQFNYAWRLKQAGHYHEALAAYEQALALNIEGPEEIYLNMGVIHSDCLRQEQQAQAMLEKALAINPRYTPALLNLGNLYEEYGDKDKARTTYEALLEVDATAFDALARLGNVKTVSSPDDPFINDLLQAAQRGDVAPLTRASLYFAAGKALNEAKTFERAFGAYRAGNIINAQAFRHYDPTAQEKLTDQLIATFSAPWFKSLKPISKAAPLFICGMFRSGSTLVEQILASHKDVTAGGELTFFPSLMHNELKPFPDSLNSVDKASLNSYAAAYLKTLSELFPDADHVTDKRPDNFIALGLIKSLFPNAKFIFTTRNPLDNCLSVYFTQLAENMAYAGDLMTIGHYYKEHMRLMAHWKDLFAGNIHSISYDDLVDKPQDEISALLAFLGLPWDENCLHFHALDNVVKTASYWQVREPLYKKSSGRWHHYEQHVLPLKAYLESHNIQ